MSWKVAAEGASFSELEQTIADMELPKGTRMRVIMDTPVSWVFDMAGAELAFKPFVPDGMELIDVYGEGGQGIVEMEADPAWLVVTLAFIKAHWLAIIIAGFVLALIVQFIRVMIEVPAWAQPPIWLLVGAAVIVLILATRGQIRGKT